VLVCSSVYSTSAFSILAGGPETTPLSASVSGFTPPAVYIMILPAMGTIIDRLLLFTQAQFLIQGMALLCSASL